MNRKKIHTITKIHRDKKILHLWGGGGSNKTLLKSRSEKKNEFFERITFI